MAATAPRGVLIVEDEEELRTLFAVLLEMENFTVYQAEDGQAGLDMLKAHQDDIALMITDLGMPNIGGVELITKARAINPSVKIMATSGMTGREIEEAVRLAGADAFLPKPFSPLEAIRKLKALLEPS